VQTSPLRTLRARKKISNREFLEFARPLRLERVMGPYLQVVP
jgi:hypothetical protein